MTYAPDRAEVRVFRCRCTQDMTVVLPLPNHESAFRSPLRGVTAGTSTHRHGIPGTDPAEHPPSACGQQSRLRLYEPIPIGVLTVRWGVSCQSQRVISDIGP